jgi:hypothetical protein
MQFEKKNVGVEANLDFYVKLWKAAGIYFKPSM